MLKIIFFICIFKLYYIFIYQLYDSLYTGMQNKRLTLTLTLNKIVPSFLDVVCHSSGWFLKTCSRRARTKSILFFQSKKLENISTYECASLAFSSWCILMIENGAPFVIKYLHYFDVFNRGVTRTKKIYIWRIELNIFT